MEQIGLAICITVGVVFGYIVCWAASRKERTVEQQSLLRLRQENAAMRAAQLEAIMQPLPPSPIPPPPAPTPDQAASAAQQEAASAALQEQLQNQERMLEHLRAELMEQIRQREQRVEAGAQEITRLRREASHLRAEKSSIEAVQAAFAEKLRDQEERLVTAGVALEQARRENEELRALPAATPAANGASHTGPAEAWPWLPLPQMLERSGLGSKASVDAAGRVTVDLGGGRRVLVDACGGEDLPSDAVGEWMEQAALAAEGGRCELAVLVLPSEDYKHERDRNNLPGVVLASPATLGLTLRMAAQVWRPEPARSPDVAAAGQTLHDRLRIFAACLEDVRKNLTRSVESYNQASKAFEQRVLPSAKQLRDISSPGIIPAGSVDSVAEALEMLCQANPAAGVMSVDTAVLRR